MILPQKITGMKHMNISIEGKLIDGGRLPDILNPFCSDEEFFEYYIYLSTSSKVKNEELRAFADSRYWCQEYPYILNRMDLYRLQLSVLSHQFTSEEIQCLITIVEKHKEFFTESKHEEAYNLSDLFFFVVAKVEERAFRELPDKDTIELKYWWLYQEDLMQCYYRMGFYRVIATVYHQKGYEWFCEDAYTDPVRYKWTILAIQAAKKCCKSEKEGEALQDDLYSLYEDILMILAKTDDIEDLKQIKDDIKYCMKHWDDERLESARQQLTMFENKTFHVLEPREVIQKTKKVIQEEVKDVQDRMEDEDRKIQSLLRCVTSLAKTADLGRVEIENTISFWDLLLPQSQEDIKKSLNVMAVYADVDLALLPLFRTLEREFNYHFIKRYQNTAEYHMYKNTKCTAVSWRQVHESLKGTVMLGGIPFLGRAVADDRAKRDSLLINSFSNFLGSHLSGFCTICQDIDSYRFTVKKFTIAKVRNGIAHGNEDIIKCLDKESYDSIFSLLYNPPIQLLQRIFENSKDV